MTLFPQILATYTGPRRVFRGLFATTASEARSLTYLIVGLFIAFAAMWPEASENLKVSMQDAEAFSGLSAMLFLALIFIVFFVILFYALAFISGKVLWLIGHKIADADARLALFWAFLAAVPWLLFIALLRVAEAGEQAENIGGVLWIGFWVLFWVIGLIEARKAEVGNV